MAPTKHRTALVLALATVIAYANTLTNSFVWDDGTLVTRNSFIRNSIYLDTAFTTDLFHDSPASVAYYRPLQTISFMVDYFLWGVKPFGYHLTNLLLHLTCVLLVWLVAERLTQERMLAFLVAMFFAVHPVNTNAVAYVSGRADPLALVGMLGSFLLFLHYRSIPQDARPARTAAFAASMICFVGALLSRENALILPFLIFLYCFIVDAPEKAKLSYALASVAPFAILSTSFIVWRFMVLDSCAKPWLSEPVMPIALRIQVFFRAVATYTNLLVWPSHLQMDRRLADGDGWLHALTLVGVLATVGVAWVMRWSYRASRLAFFGLCWFVVTLLPMVAMPGLVAVVAEHWLYASSVGFYLAVGAICAYMLKRSDTVTAHRLRQGAAFACVIALVALTARTIRRNQDWATDSSLYSQTKQSAPQSLRVQVNLAHMHLTSGQSDQALEEFLQVERQCHRGPLVQIVKGNLAAAYFLKGDLERAVAKNEECLQLDPNDTDARLRLAEIWEQRGDLTRAKRNYVAASASNTAAKPRLLLGRFLLRHRQIEESLQIVEEAYELEPGNAEVFNLLGAILVENGHPGKAREAFEMARDLDRHFTSGTLNPG
jgi:Flp pilus assembly protein TadD